MIFAMSETAINYMALAASIAAAAIYVAYLCSKEEM